MKPYVICHMVSSVDGKIDGSALSPVMADGEYEAAGWVKNIRRNPKVTVRIGEWRIDATASVLDRHSQVSSLLLFAASACTYRTTMARPVRS